MDINQELNFPSSWKIKKKFNINEDVVLTVETLSKYLIQLECFGNSELWGVVIKNDDWSFPLGFYELKSTEQIKQFISHWVKKINIEESGIKRFKKPNRVRFNDVAKVEKRLSDGKMVWGRVFYREDKIPHFFQVSLSNKKGTFKILVEDYDARYDSFDIVFKDEKHSFESFSDLWNYLEENTPIKLEHLYYH